MATAEELSPSAVLAAAYARGAAAPAGSDERRELIVALATAHRWHEAAHYVAALLRDHPDDVWGLRIAALVALELGRVEHAQEHARRLEALSAHDRKIDAILWAVVVAIQLSAGDTSRACEAARAALDVGEPFDPMTIRAALVAAGRGDAADIILRLVDHVTEMPMSKAEAENVRDTVRRQLLRCLYARSRGGG